MWPTEYLLLGFFCGMIIDPVFIDTSITWTQQLVDMLLVGSITAVVLPPCIFIVEITLGELYENWNLRRLVKAKEERERLVSSIEADLRQTSEAQASESDRPDGPPSGPLASNQHIQEE